MPEEEIHSDTEKPKKKRGNPQNLIPFKKGKGADRDPRINVSNRPTGFSQLRKLVLEVGGEIARDKKGKAVVIDKGLPTEHEATIAELILREWAADKNHSHKFIEYGWGKVPVKNEISGNVTLSWKDFIEGTDASNSSTSSTES